MPGRVLRYRAGRTARRTLRERGLDRASVGALFGPASGPKWIVLAALDRALLGSGLLARRENPGEPPLLLAGASAGAWRMLALATREPERTHRLLFDRYVGMRFSPGATPPPEAISAAYREMLEGLFPAEEIDRLVDGRGIDLAIHTARARRVLPGWSVLPRAAQSLTLAMAGLARLLHRSGSGLVLERVLFHTSPERFTATFDGATVRLDARNLVEAALAAGTVPVHMAPQPSPAGAPPGRYLDGGLTDYHLNQRYLPPADERIVLLPHYQRTLVPAWFDRWRTSRAPRPDALDNVLQLYPSDEFVATLPDARVPDREDFFRFADDPHGRIEQWSRAAALGERLAEQFVDDLEHGRIAELAEPL